jgi:hypothetical protein
MANLRCGESYPGALEVPNLVDWHDVWGLGRMLFRTRACERVYVPT